MKRSTFIKLGAVLAGIAALAAIPPPASTSFTRSFLKTTNATEAAALLGVTTGVALNVNATNVNPVNVTNTSTVTWAISGSNVSATAVLGISSLSFNGTN